MFRVIFFILFSAVIKYGSGLSIRRDDGDFGIIGGVEVEIEQFPHQVSLLGNSSNLLWCSGSILSEDIILTAAHCAAGVFLYIFQVRAGSTFCNKGGRIYKILSRTIHPKYSDGVFEVDYDVGIIRTEKMILDGVTTKPIQLAEADSSLKPGDLVDVTGWGQTETRVYSKVLKFVSLAVVDLQECKKAYAEFYDITVTDRVVCAKHDDPHKGACFGDSGGPMLAHSKAVQTGIVSFGPRDCICNQVPDGYTYIPAVRDWIREVTGI